MKIIKYQQINKDKYNIILENNQVITLFEDIIVNNNLLYKKELDEKLYNILLEENMIYEYYIRCIKYIGIRLRSIAEIKKYLIKYKLSDDIINNIITRLVNNNILNDMVFAKAFVNDKLNFTSMGPYKIKNALQLTGVSNEIIDDAFNNISDNIVINKIDKIISKSINSKSNYTGYVLRDKIYNKLFSLGYPSDLIVKQLKNYFFE